MRAVQCIFRTARAAICQISGDATKRRNSRGRTSFGRGVRRTTSDLLTLIRTTMPPGNRGNLGDENYVNLVAFLLLANGAQAGNQPLIAAARVAIGSVATGKMPAALRKTLDEHYGGCAGGRSRPPGRWGCWWQVK